MLTFFTNELEILASKKSPKRTNPEIIIMITINTIGSLNRKENMD